MNGSGQFKDRARELIHLIFGLTMATRILEFMLGLFQMLTVPMLIDLKNVAKQLLQSKYFELDT